MRQMAVAECKCLAGFPLSGLTDTISYFIVYSGTGRPNGPQDMYLATLDGPFSMCSLWLARSPPFLDAAVCFTLSLTFFPLYDSMLSCLPRGLRTRRSFISLALFHTT
jgi:hypothetical protein